MFSSLQFAQTPSAQWCADPPHRMLMETEKQSDTEKSEKEPEFTFKVIAVVMPSLRLFFTCIN